MRVVYDAPRDHVTGWTRLQLRLLIWTTYCGIRLGLMYWRLPELTRRLATRRRAKPFMSFTHIAPPRLGKMVRHVLRIGQRRSRCLHTSLVLYQLLRRDGIKAELVIGLPAEPVNHIAHAWVEVAGRVVGPPPGRLDYQELVRYPEVRNTVTTHA